MFSQCSYECRAKSRAKNVSLCTDWTVYLCSPSNIKRSMSEIAMRLLCNRCLHPYLSKNICTSLTEIKMSQLSLQSITTASTVATNLLLR